MNASPSTPHRRARRLGLPALVLLLTTVGLTTAACGHTYHGPYARGVVVRHDGYYGDGYYRDITRSYYSIRNRRARRQYHRRLDDHGRRFYRSLESHHRRFHRRRGTLHRWGQGRWDACLEWEARWRPDRRNRYDRRDRYDRDDRRYDTRRNRRPSYGSVTLEYYRQRGRDGGGRDFFVNLDAPLQRFYRSLDRHDERYHRRSDTTHRWNGYDSGECYEWERQWDDERYTTYGY